MHTHNITHYCVTFLDVHTNKLVTIEQPFTVAQVTALSHNYLEVEGDRVAITRTTAHALLDKWNTQSVRQGGTYRYFLTQ